MRSEITEFADAKGYNTSKQRLSFVAGALLVTLIIGCSNLATLLFSRTLERASEFDVRASLGATGRRLGFEVFTEIVLIGVAGAGIAAFVFVAGSRLMIGRMSSALGVVVSWSQWQSAMTIITLSAVATVVIAIPSVVFAMRRRGSIIRRDSASALSATVRHKRTQVGLLGLQVALSVVLLTGAVMLWQSVYNVAGFDIGYNPARVVDGTVDMARAGSPGSVNYSEAQEVLADMARGFSPRDVAAWHQTAVSRRDGRPAFTRGDLGETHSPPGWPPALPVVSMDVSGEFFRVLGVRVIEGRTFADPEGVGGTPVVILSRRAARRLWPSGSAVGRRLKLGPADEASPWMTVIGVVEDVVNPSKGGFFFAVSARQHSVPLMYRPLSQVAGYAGPPDGPFTADVHFLVRLPLHGGAAYPARLDSILISRVGAKFHDRPQLLSGQMLSAEPIRRLRTIAWTLQVLAGFGLALVLIGFVAHTIEGVVRDQRDLAIRAALGSSPVRLLMRVVRRSVLTALVGATLGFIALLGLRGVLGPILDGASPIIQTGLLYGLSSGDPGYYLFAVACGLLVAAVAAVIPAARFAWSDPARALR